MPLDAHRQQLHEVRGLRDETAAGQEQLGSAPLHAEVVHGVVQLPWAPDLTYSSPIIDILLY